MSVNARFFVQTITRHAYNPGAGNVVLSAVARGEANKSWAAATPGGTINMTISNPDAMQFFDERLGKELALQFVDPPENE